MRCIERLSDKKNHKFYFKLRKMRSMDVPDGSFCFFGERNDCNFSNGYFKIGDADDLSIYFKFRGDCQQFVFDKKRYVYVLLFCFTEKTYVTINREIQYGKYGYHIYNYIFNLLKPTLL